MEKIVSLQLQRVGKLLEDRKVSLKWNEAVVEHLAKEGYDPIFGARPLKRLVQQEVVNLFATGILEGKIPTHCELILTGEPQGDGFSLHYEVVKK